LSSSLGDGGFALPYKWLDDHIEDTMYLGRYDNTDLEIIAHNLIMAQAWWGYGSLSAEGPVNSIGALLGSLDYVLVEQARTSLNTVSITVKNTMDKASVSRKIGTSEHWLESHSRAEGWPGGTIELYFHWEEARPAGCWLSILRQYSRPTQPGI
jgi:hypothetical protein